MPEEVEDVLTGHPAVAQAHVVPLRDRMGEVPVTPSGRPRKFLLAQRAAEELA